MKYSNLELKQVEQFEDDDDNDNDSDDVEDVSIHGSWITPRYPRWQAIRSAQRGIAASRGMVLARFEELSCGAG